MNTHTLTASLLAVTAALALTACSTEDASTSTATATPGGAATSGSAPGASTAAQQPSDSTAAVADPAAVLEVEDQTSEGPTVRVKLAAVTDGGFVVVAGDGGKDILGFANVPVSPTAATLQVSLADEVNEKTELVAMLYRDDDHSGLFDAGDRPVTNGKADSDDDPKAFPGELETFSFTGKPVVNS